MRIGSASPYVRELANMMTLSELAGYVTAPSVLHGTFGLKGLTIRSGPAGPLIVMRYQGSWECPHEASRREMDV
jgi:hypothetical protein